MVKTPRYSLGFAFVEGLELNMESERVGKVYCNYLAAWYYAPRSQHLELVVGCSEASMHESGPQLLRPRHG